MAACSAYAEFDLSSQPGAPIALVIYNDENARLIHRDIEVDGVYIREEVQFNGLATLPDGRKQPVACTCSLTSPGEPVGLLCKPR